MIVRAIDGNNDWTFGKGKNNYKRNGDAVAQNIQTRLQSFLGDCFFDLGAGVDWFTLLGGKSRVALTLAISAQILNTENVTKLVELNVNLDRLTRNMIVEYSVNTAFTTVSGTATLSL